MATRQVTAAGHAHHAPSGFVWKYIFSKDHKVVGIQYILLALFSVFVGMALSLLMRIHLAWPDLKLPFVPGGSILSVQYVALITMHGYIMVLLVLSRALWSGFGRYFLASQ